jgi:Ca-activated chloride channel family protein
MAMPAHSISPSAPSTPASGGALVSLDGRTLPLRHTTLAARAKGGVARTVVRQTFMNTSADALEVTYQLPLPVDGAVSGFRFELDGVEVVGEVDRKHRARERYEQAIVEGRTAALLDQERPNLFTQRVGNIPPRSTVVCEVTVDQRLTWLDEGAWEWRFPTVVGARYLGAEGRVADAAKVRVEASEKPLPHRLGLELMVADTIPGGYGPESPTHPTEVVRGDGAAVVSFREGEGARLDRDVVVRWPVAESLPGLALDVAKAPEGAGDAGSAYGLLTITPPTPAAKMKALPRDLIFLIDTSGSMGGKPLAQAARVASAMIDTLTERDRVEVIEFSSEPRRWKVSPVYATEAYKREAVAWVKGLTAGGSTEMRAALLAALEPLRAGAQRQVVLITDGYIGFEREIVETVYRKLPSGCRLHTLGVGSSVNRALTGPAAQAGRGVEQVVGLDEDAERAARRLVERTHAPLLTELTVEGAGAVVVAPARLPDVFAASPVLISLKLGAPGTTVRVRAKSDRGSWEQTIRVPEATSAGSGAVRARFARDRVEDHELHLAAGGDASEIDRAIEALGVDYQIATRLTSWVAVSRERTVDPEAKRRAETQPQEVPYGVSAEGMGLRAASGVMPVVMPMMVDGDALDDLGLADESELDMVVNSTLTTGSFLPREAREARPEPKINVGGMMAPSAPPPAQPPLAKPAPAPAPARRERMKLAKEESPAPEPAEPAPMSAAMPAPSKQAPMPSPSMSVRASVESASVHEPRPYATRRARSPWLLVVLLLVLAALAVLVYRAVAGGASDPTPRRETPALPAPPQR